MNSNFKVRKMLALQAFLLLACFVAFAQQGSDSQHVTTPAQEELTSTNAKPAESNTNWPLIMLVPVFLIGAGLGYYFSKKKPGENTIKNNEEISQAENEPENKITKKELSNQHKLLKAAQNKIAELESEHNTLQSKYDMLYDEHTDMLNFDKAYFDACNKKVVSPFWEAVNQKDEKKAVENAFKGIAQLTAISRLKLNIHQSFDEYNINKMMDKAVENNYKQIDENTNKDNIPDNINTLISILKKNNVSALGDTNFQGYTLNNLDK